MEQNPNRSALDESGQTVCEGPQYPNLKTDLGGCIFKARSKEEADTFLSKRIFWAEEAHYKYIRYVKEGMAIFMLVDTELWGHFEAISDGELSHGSKEHNAQVKIRIVQQCQPLPATVFLPIFGRVSTVKHMPLELTVGQAKSLVHTFVNGRHNTLHSSQEPPPLPQNPAQSYPEDWDYSKGAAPPPVPHQRRYAGSMPYGFPYPGHPGESRVRGPPEMWRPPSIRPQMEAGYLPEPGYGTPHMQYQDHPQYYGPPPPYHWPKYSYEYYDNTPFSENRPQASRQPSKTSMGYDGAKMESKSVQQQVSVEVQTDDDEKQGLDAKIRELTQEVERYRDEQKCLHDKLRIANEEESRLQQLLLEKNATIEQQDIELTDVRAEFFSSYDEQATRSNYQSQQLPQHLLSRPVSPGGSQLSYQSAPPPPHTGYQSINPPQNNPNGGVNTPGQHLGPQNSGETPGAPQSDHGTIQMPVNRYPSPPPVINLPQPPQRQASQPGAYPTVPGSQPPKLPVPPGRTAQYNTSAADSTYTGNPVTVPTPPGQPRSQSPLRSPRWQPNAAEVPGAQPSTNPGVQDHQEYHQAQYAHQDTQNMNTRTKLGPLGGAPLSPRISGGSPFAMNRNSPENYKEHLTKSNAESWGQ